MNESSFFHIEISYSIVYKKKVRYPQNLKAIDKDL